MVKQKFMERISLEIAYKFLKLRIHQESVIEEDKRDKKWIARKERLEKDLKNILKLCQGKGVKRRGNETSNDSKVYNLIDKIG